MRLNRRRRRRSKRRRGEAEGEQIRQKEKKIKQRERYSDRQYTAYGRVGVSDTFTTLMVPKQCPLVLLVKLRW
jgi:hypothetical protein